MSFLQSHPLFFPVSSMRFRELHHPDVSVVVQVTEPIFKLELPEHVFYLMVPLHLCKVEEEPVAHLRHVLYALEPCAVRPGHFRLARVSLNGV